MRPPDLLKGNRITQQIILWILLIASVSFLVQSISEYLTGKKVEAAKSVTLPELLVQANTGGDVVQLEDYAIDIKHRINALPDPDEKKDVHIMVPLRPIGQDDNEPAVALFVLQEYAYNCVESALDDWKDSLINLRSGEAMYVELLALDDLPGNVPNVVRSNERVGKKLLVLREVDYNGSESALLFASLALAIAAFIVYRRLQKLKELELNSRL